MNNFYEIIRKPFKSFLWNCTVSPWDEKRNVPWISMKKLIRRRELNFGLSRENTYSQKTRTAIWICWFSKALRIELNWISKALKIHSGLACITHYFSPFYVCLESLQRTEQSSLYFLSALWHETGVSSGRCVKKIVSFPFIVLLD